MPSVPSEPAIKRAVTFIDGQNLFHAVRKLFGHAYPNYDVRALSETICYNHGWNLIQVRFYTGIHDRVRNPLWHSFWSDKLAVMGRDGVHIFTRPVIYRKKIVDCAIQSILTGEEKGIDVRIALDVIRMAHRNEYDVAVLFSQDQDFVEVAEEIRAIAQGQGRWIKLASAFPISPTARNPRGIYKTDWIAIDRATYDACIDHRDYRPKRPNG